MITRAITSEHDHEDREEETTGSAIARKSSSKAVPHRTCPKAKPARRPSPPHPPEGQARHTRCLM